MLNNKGHLAGLLIVQWLHYMFLKPGVNQERDGLSGSETQAAAKAMALTFKAQCAKVNPQTFNFKIFIST